MKNELTIKLFEAADTAAVVELFTRVFTASENETEGQLIGELAAELVATTPAEDLIGFVATCHGLIVGCIFFSRFSVPGEKTAFILSPVAIDTNEQGTGTGQQLINTGLDHLQALGVELVFTYGDPKYYGKTGFQQISETIVQAPFELSQPHGWQAQSLDGSELKAMPGSTQCVAALCKQEYW